MGLSRADTEAGIRCKRCNEPLLDCTCGKPTRPLKLVALAGKRSPFADCFKLAQPVRARRFDK